MLLGKDIAVTSDGSAIEDLRSVELSLDGETIDITTLDSNQLEEKLSGKKSMSLVLSGVRDDAATYGLNDILDAQVAGNKLAIVITYANVGVGDREKFTISMLVEDFSEDNPDGGENTQSVTLQSDGEPTITTKLV